MSKVRVNYKSDLPPVAVKFKINGNVVDVPDHDFIIRFFVDGAPGASFECIHKGDEYINCAKTAADTLTCYIDNHKFGCGRLCCEFIDISADSRYSDKVFKTVTPSCLDVVLVDGVGDDNIEVLTIIFGYEINEIANITAEESEEDGGTNVVTITETNGEEFSFGVKNGNKGNGIATIGVSESSASDGYNVVTITQTNGTVITFRVKNGANGVIIEGDPVTLIADDLLTNDSEKILSAKQGYVLKGLIDNIGVKSGTYADALDAILASNSVLEFLLVDEVDSDELIKPLWYVNGSLVDAAGAVVSLATLTAPVFSRDSGDVYVGTTVTITCPSGSTLYYSVNGVVATSTSDVIITINEASVVKAYLKSGDAVSDIVAKNYGIAIDHRFQFKIALTGNNSTEYVPVCSGGDPRYTMTVDWGDGSTPSEYNNQGFSAKGCNHAYTGSAGDEFTITLRGSAIPYLAFSVASLCNVGALVAILDNTLECQTNFSNVNTSGSFGFKDCTNLESMSANALSNSNTANISFRGCTKLTSVPTGFFANLHNLTSANGMFYDSVLVFTNDNLDELKVAIKNATDLGYLFYSFDGTLAIPDDFFDEVTATVASVANMFNSVTSSNVSGDAKALYDVLVTKVSNDATTSNCFSSTRLSNRDQVPSAWGGTGS